MRTTRESQGDRRPPRHHRLWWPLWVFAFVWSSCGEGTFTQVFIEIASDPPEYAQGADAFEISLWSEDFGERLHTVTLPDDVTWSVPFAIPVAARNDDGTARFAVRAELFEGGTSLGVQRAIGGFVQGERRTVRLVFRPDCQAMTCGDQETCVAGGTCGPACYAFEEAGEAVFVACDAPCPDCAGDCDPSTEVCADTLTLGADHSCALHEGTAACWGDGTGGQLGSSISTSRTPVPLPSPMAGVDWASFSAGNRVTCGVVTGRLYCTGEGPEGDASMMTAVGTLGSWQQVSTNGRFACGVHTDGAIQCVGMASGLRPGRFEGTWTQVCVRRGNACALDDGERSVCWGRNQEGQNGDGSIANSDDPGGPLSTLRFTEVAPSGSHGCGRTPGGALYCWGDAEVGALGVGDGPFDRCGASHECALEPVQVEGMGWSSVCTGFRFSCGVREQALYCWGINEAGQLGIGSSGGTRRQPTLVDEDSAWRQVACGDEHACAIDMEGRVFCWGNNGRGQVGAAGDAVLITMPTRVTR